ncbi:Putative F-box protein PP2-B12 [Linum perenne]
MTATTTEEETDIANYLPGECLAQVISFTSPADASRCSSVSRSFQSVADSDQVWNRFLPSDYEDTLASWAEELSLVSNKELYLHICDNPILINNGTMSFTLEKKSGKKCYMIGARGLAIVWGDNPTYWTWTSLPFSRFEQVAELNYVWWFDIKGRIQTRMLSTMTNYGVYFVFKFTLRRYGLYGFSERPVELGVNLEGSGIERKRVSLIDSVEGMPKPYKEREDGWLEIEMGEFFNHPYNGDGDGDGDATLLCSLMETDGNVTKESLLVYGIELRPK